MTRQSVVVADERGNAFSPLLTYDPVTRVVAVWNPAQNGQPWFTSGMTYNVYLQLPSSPTDRTGLRAIDGASLDPTQPATSRVIGFSTTDPTGAGPPAAVSFCSDVLPVLQLQCGTPTCHASSLPGGPANANAAEGLLLDSADGLRATAIGFASHESSEGAQPNTVAPRSLSFGANMAIIDPGAPGSSFLMYKVLLAPPKASTTCEHDSDCWSIAEVCVSGTCAALEAACDGGASMPSLTTFSPEAHWAAPSSAEQGVLSAYILGREMPYPANPGVVGPPSNTTLTLNELERIRLWIAQGANLSDCLTCGGPL